MQNYKISISNTILWLVTLVSGCTNSPADKQVVARDTKQVEFSLINIKLDSTKFRFLSLDTFDLRDWNYGEMEKLKTLTKDEVKAFFQGTKPYLDSLSVEKFKFFSIQKNTPEEKAVTIIVDDDICCAHLFLLSYNKNGKLLSNDVVAGTGGDGGWGYDHYGFFSDNSTYKSFRVDIENIRDDPDTLEYSIDSVTTVFSYSEGKPMKKLKEQKFNRKKVEVAKKQ